MSIDKELREELHQAADSVHCPPHLYGRVRESYQHYVNEKRGRNPMKKRILIAFAAVAILIPSAVLASNYLADDIFGSPTVLEQYGDTAESYEVFEEFFQTAKDKLTKDEFKEYMELTKQFMQLKLKIMDKNGIAHEENLTEEEQQQYELLQSKIAPYFEKITDVTNP